MAQGGDREEQQEEDFLLLEMRVAREQLDFQKEMMRKYGDDLYGRIHHIVAEALRAKQAESLVTDKSETTMAA